MECVALKAAVFLPILALQKPSHSSKNKDHVVCIKRRLYLWLDGSLTELIKESRAIQHRLPNSWAPNGTVLLPLLEGLLRKMFQEKMKAALDILRSKEMGGVLQLLDHTLSL